MNEEKNKPGIITPFLTDEQMEDMIEFSGNTMEVFSGMEKVREVYEPELNKYKTLSQSAIAVLREIAKGQGRFSRDQFEHCHNTVEDMKELATEFLKQIE